MNEDKACKYTLISEHDIKGSDISSEVDLLLASSYYSDEEGVYVCWNNFIGDMKKLSKSKDDTFVVEVSLCEDVEDTVYIFEKGEVSLTPSSRFFENRCLVCFSDDISVKIVNIEFASRNGNKTIRNEKMMHCFNCKSLLISQNFNDPNDILIN